MRNSHLFLLEILEENIQEKIESGPQKSCEEIGRAFACVTELPHPILLKIFS
jgi:hypothetical protein